MRTQLLHDVVLITSSHQVKAGNNYGDRLPGATIHVLSLRPVGPQVTARTRANVRVTHCAGLKQIAEYLALIAPPEAIVDLGPTLGLQRRRLAALFFLLADGGTYVVREDIPDGGTPTLERTLTRLRTGRLTKAMSEHRGWDTALARSLDVIGSEGRLVIAGKHGAHALKLRDPQTSPALTARSGDAWGMQLASRPAVRFESRATVWTNQPGSHFRDVMDVPELFLREYRDVICAQRGVAVSNGTLLPISFNRLLTPALSARSPYSPNVSRWSVALDDALDDPPLIEGVYFHLDSPYPWGFGHFMGEDMSKLWAFEQARARHPDLKVLLSSASRRGDPPPDGKPRAHQLALLAAVGISPADVVCLDGPARVEMVVGASRMWDNPRFIHPDITEIWAARREALRSPVAERGPTPAKVFVSRGHDLRRHCRNAIEIEQLFASHGYEIVQPEKLDMRAQVDLFAGAEAIAGFGGSANFNMMHAERPGRRIVLASTLYQARNEYLISAAQGGDYHHFSCEPVRPDSAEEQAWGPFHWDYEFDFARDGAALEALLRD